MRVQGIKKPRKVSRQEWRLIQSAQMKKYAGMDEGEIPEIGYVFAHNGFYIICNIGLGAFEVEVHLDPATQKDIINDILEVKQIENDERFSQIDW